MRAVLKSWLEIDARRLEANFASIQASVGAQVEVLAVVKADAYGHGAVLCAPVLAKAGARWLGVSDVDEARTIQSALQAGGLGPSRLIVMCGFEPADAGEIVAHSFTPVVWTAAHLHALQAVQAAAQVTAQAQPAKVCVHIEVDTGMSRQGVSPGVALQALLSELAACPGVECEGFFTHLSCSESVGGEQTLRQLASFAAAICQLGEAGIRPRFLHLANTSALDEGSTLAWLKEQARRLGAQAMVRPGLALYGYALPLQAGAAQTHTQNTPLHKQLRPVATWKARILDVHEIAAGTTVGYGAGYIAPHSMRLALLPVGYADGFRREASSGIGNGWVMIAGARAPVVGRVSMNLTVVDIRAIPSCAIGDEVVLLGEGVTADDHARWCGTISYDLLCTMRAHRRLV